jgi:chromosomal replication initiation ATPase DnaA
MTVTEEIDLIQRRVAAAYGVSLGEIISMRRGRPLEARLMAMWLARRLTGASYPVLGRSFERCHTTVLCDVRSFERRIAANPISMMQLDNRAREMPRAGR